MLYVVEHEKKCGGGKLLCMWYYVCVFSIQRKRTRGGERESEKSREHFWEKVLEKELRLVCVYIYVCVRERGRETDRVQTLLEKRWVECVWRVCVCCHCAFEVREGEKLNKLAFGL